MWLVVDSHKQILHEQNTLFHKQHFHTFTQTEDLRIKHAICFCLVLEMFTWFKKKLVSEEKIFKRFFALIASNKHYCYYRATPTIVIPIDRLLMDWSSNQ